MTGHEDRFQDCAGPYLMGALDELEATAFEEHLLECTECWSQVDRLRPVVGLLGAVSAEELARIEDTPYAVEPRPDTLLPGLLARAARRRRRRRAVAAAVGALAVAAAASVVVLVATGDDGTDPVQAATTTRIAMTPRHDGRLRATAQMAEVPWGTQITLRCHYTGHGSYGGYSGERPRVYTLQIDGVEGSTHDIGSWSVRNGDEMVFTSGTALTREEIEQIEVLAPDGTVVLRSTTS